MCLCAFVCVVGEEGKERNSTHTIVTSIKDEEQRKRRRRRGGARKWEMVCLL